MSCCSSTESTISVGFTPAIGCLGILKDTLNKCFLVQVADQRATTLEAEIWEYIKPDSHIMSDIWAAYANIVTIDNRVYLHSSINHSQNFVHPIDQEIHTQTIENMWMREKRKLKRQFGDQKHYLVHTSMSSCSSVQAIRK